MAEQTGRVFPILQPVTDIAKTALASCSRSIDGTVNVAALESMSGRKSAYQRYTEVTKPKGVGDTGNMFSGASRQG